MTNQVFVIHPVCAWSPGEGVETFQVGSSQVMFHPDFIQAVTGESLNGGDFALIFLNRWRFSNTTANNFGLTRFVTYGFLAL